MEYVPLLHRGTNTIRTLWTRRQNGSAVRYDRLSSQSPPCTPHWEVHWVACYSPILWDVAGETFPHLKEAPLSPGTWIPRHPCLPRLQDKDTTSWGMRLSLHCTWGWDVGPACAQGTSKKIDQWSKQSKKKSPTNKKVSFI